MSVGSPNDCRPFIPEVWSRKIFEHYAENLVAQVPPRMIDNHKLKALTEGAADVPGLEDLADALRELQWRRLQQGKLDKKMTRLQQTIAEVRPAMTGESGWLRRKMALLKF
jgi:hypothetical protein